MKDVVHECNPHWTKPNAEFLYDFIECAFLPRCLNKDIDYCITDPIHIFRRSESLKCCKMSFIFVLSEAVHLLGRPRFASQLRAKERDIIRDYGEVRTYIRKIGLLYQIAQFSLRGRLHLDRPASPTTATNHPFLLNSSVLLRLGLHLTPTTPKSRTSNSLSFPKPLLRLIKMRG